MNQSTPQDLEEILIFEDVDLSDESELRRVVGEVEGLVPATGRGLRVSVLSAEQWETMLRKALTPAMRRGAERYMHTLRHRTDPQHLLVSPSAVRGINERSRVIYQEVVFAVLRCLPCQLNRPLRKGLDDIVAGYCGERIGVELFISNYPEETALVRRLLQVCQSEHGYKERDWAIEMRRNPERFFLALRKTKFAALWVARARRNGELKKVLAESENKRAALINALVAPNLTMNSPIVRHTNAVLDEYFAAQEKSAKKSKDQKS